MTPEVIGAILSDYVYSRSSANRQVNITSLFPGATQIGVSDDPDSGFYAEAWQINGAVWIAFRGTDFAAPNLSDWNDGNIPLAIGNTSAAQLLDAIDFVNQVKNLNQGTLSNVVFTGHSLGGGLAGLMTSMYGNKSYVYAPAPFRQTSDSPTFIPQGLSGDQIAILLAGPPKAPRWIRHIPTRSPRPGYNTTQLSQPETR